MASRKDKRFRELKKSHTWIWIIVFTLLVLVTGVLTGLFISLFGSSVISDKLKAEFSAVRYTADVFEVCEREGTDPAPFIEKFGRDCIITDKSHNILYSAGRNTCCLDYNEHTADRFVFVGIDVPMVIDYVYPDSEYSVIFGEEDSLTIDLIELIRNSNEFINADIDDLHNPGDLTDDMLCLPLWIGADMNGGERQFIARSYLTVQVYDLINLAALTVGIGALVFLIYTVMIVNIVSGILRRRKTLKVFFTDAVTQGNNLMYYIYNGGARLRQRWNYGSRYAAVSLTFVGYRNFCVCHSVEEGERMLGLIYKNIGYHLSDKREICAHVGEADFALLLRDGDQNTFRERVQAVIDAVSKVNPDHLFAFHAGIAVIEPDGTPGADGAPVSRRNTDIGEIYNNACAAREVLADTDESGIEFFNEKIVEDRRWVDAVQERQRQALDNEEFVVYYQPKYDPRTDELCGAEALIRWQSPELGFVPPGRMIPIFEKNGFITEIDHYMITHAARDQKRWLDSGCRCVPVSVNVSRSHFIESDLAEQIRDAVDAEGTPHRLIEIELTESAFFDDKKAMINTIEKLKQYGFAVSMDDFGSGYSSLNSLKDMPLDVLKLDAEFFRGENGGGRGEIVVSEAIRLAKSLNMRTVAEGVEVREQVDFLAEQGCDMIQGYFYAKPMPGSDFEVRMNERYKPKEE